jgi:hypothetical protein
MYLIYTDYRYFISKHYYATNRMVAGSILDEVIFKFT